MTDAGKELMHIPSLTVQERETPSMKNWLLPSGLGLLVVVIVFALVGSFVAARLRQLEDRIDEKFGTLSSLESQRALNAAQCLDTAESGATKRSASGFAVLRARQDKLEKELVRKADLELLATKAQVDYFSARTRAQFEKLTSEIRKPMAYLPKAK